MKQIRSIEVVRGEDRKNVSLYKYADGTFRLKINGSSSVGEITTRREAVRLFRHARWHYEAAGFRIKRR